VFFQPSALARTFRTVRHLRLSQVYWRVRYRLERSRRAVVPPVPDEIEISDDFPEVPLVLHDVENDGSSGDDLVALLEQGRFRHLNETRALGIAPTDWLLGAVADNRLWTITLHYHAWAWELAERAACGGDDAQRADKCLRRLLGDWIDNCGLEADGSRDLAWNAYAISTRIGWWCRLYHRLGPEGRKNWGELETRFIRSLWQQAAFLEKHIEWDLRANHLLRDIVGLAWAGRFFSGGDGHEANGWLAAATAMALEQAKEQVLPDGGHFERSPMYHIHAMEDFLVLAVLLEDQTARDTIRKTWRKMAEFLAWTRHPDGQIPLFNDGALNGACHPRHMLSTGCRALDLQVDTNPRRGGKLFADFGLAVWHGDPWSVFFDVGPVGVDYQPGHAHADTLCVEVSYQGERLFVDPGTFGYDNDESRRYDRATASHNTVSIDGTDSSEVWHIFRVGRRARPTDVSFDSNGGAFRTTASHDGYERLPGRPRHSRKLTVSSARCLTIVDSLAGSGPHLLEGGLLLDPRWKAEEADGGWLVRRGRNCLSILLEDVSLERFTEKRPYHPGYGQCDETERLCWRGVLQFPYEISLKIIPTCRF
jgi:uncharacterized heparinase superfamily protein